MTTALKKPKVHPSLSTGVYQDSGGHTAIVVQVASERGTCYYLSWAESRVSLHARSIEKFKRDFITFLPNYPVLTAVKKYYKSGFPIDDNALQVIKLVLRNARGQ